jgi:hypothetical protein
MLYKLHTLILFFQLTMAVWRGKSHLPLGTEAPQGKSPKTPTSQTPAEKPKTKSLHATQANGKMHGRAAKIILKLPKNNKPIPRQRRTNKPLGFQRLIKHGRRIHNGPPNLNHIIQKLNEAFKSMQTV